MYTWLQDSDCVCILKKIASATGIQLNLLCSHSHYGDALELTWR